jgi:hypothetical protein
MMNVENDVGNGPFRSLAVFQGQGKLGQQEKNEPGCLCFCGRVKRPGEFLQRGNWKVSEI